MAERPFLTQARQRVVDAAMDPANRTVTAIAKAAGVSLPSASVALRSKNVMAELERRKSAERDKARGFLPKAEALLHAALDESNDETPRTKAEIAGSTIRLVHEVGVTERPRDEEADQLWIRKYGRRAGRLGWRAALLHLVEAGHITAEVAESVGLSR